MFHVQRQRRAERGDKTRAPQREEEQRRACGGWVRVPSLVISFLPHPFFLFPPAASSTPRPAPEPNGRLGDLQGN